MCSGQFSLPGCPLVMESHGKSWNLGRPFFQAWKVMENSKGHGKSWKNHGK